MKAEKLPFELSPAIAGKFEVVGTHCPVLHSRIGKVDFRTISVEEAEKLIDAGTSYLKKVSRSAKIESSTP